MISLAEGREDRRGGVGMIKTCERCHREFYEEESPMTPVEELGDLFLSSTQNGQISGLCPACKEELGAMNLLGFDE